MDQAVKLGRTEDHAKTLSRYKLSIGHSLWDRDCGILPDLEHTHSWTLAKTWAGLAERMILMTDRHAYHGTIVAWVDHTRPVILRTNHPYKGLLSEH